MNTIKVAFLTHFPDDPGKPQGGVEAVNVILSKYLAQYDDLELHIINHSQNVDALTKKQLYDHAYLYTLPIHSSSSLVNANKHAVLQIENLLDDIAPDIVHAHDTYAMSCYRLTYPKVITIHGFIHSDTLLAGKRFAWLRSKIWKYYELRGWRHAGNVISISPYVRERVSRYSKAMIYDIDNPIAQEFFTDEANIEKQNIVFSAAVISPRKNTYGLVKAFSRIVNDIPDAQLHLAGPVKNQNYYNKILDWIKLNKLEDSVKLLGSISKNEVIQALRTSKVFALLSYEENSPMGIEEAMGVGLPIVTSNRCGMPYMVAHNENGYLVDPDDYDSIANKLRALLEDSSLQNNFSIKSREIALQRYHPQGIASKTRSVYHDILSRSV